MDLRAWRADATPIGQSAFDMSRGGHPRRRPRRPPTRATRPPLHHGPSARSRPACAPKRSPRSSEQRKRPPKLLTCPAPAVSLSSPPTFRRGRGRRGGAGVGRRCPRTCASTSRTTVRVRRQVGVGKARPRETARVSRSPLTASTRHSKKADGPTPARQPDTPSASGQPELHRVPAPGAAPRTRRGVTPVSMSLSVPSRHSVDSD